MITKTEQKIKDLESNQGKITDTLKEMAGLQEKIVKTIEKIANLCSNIVTLFKKGFINIVIFVLILVFRESIADLLYVAIIRPFGDKLSGLSEVWQVGLLQIVFAGIFFFAGYFLKNRIFQGTAKKSKKKR